jgi:exopolysaccharide biosynthesis predicted pyruvyltransferase EpsI
LNSFEPLLANGFKVVGMPQSLYYDDESLQRKDVITLRTRIVKGLLGPVSLQRISEGSDMADTARKVLETAEGLALAHSRVILTWREHESYEKALALYPFVSNVLSPDIAFQLGPYKALPPPSSYSSVDVGNEENLQPLLVDFVLFLRNDHESSYSSKRNRESIRQLLKPLQEKSGRSYSFDIVDWPDRIRRFKSPSGHPNDIFFTETSIKLLSMGRVLICDRLHASILAYLAGIPFVYIDQKTGKISKTLRVAFESDSICQDGDVAMWSQAKSLEKALETAVGFLDRYQLLDDK